MNDFKVLLISCLLVFIGNCGGAGALLAPVKEAVQKNVPDAKTIRVKKVEGVLVGEAEYMDKAGGWHTAYVGCGIVWEPEYPPTGTSIAQEVPATKNPVEYECDFNLDKSQIIKVEGEGEEVNYPRLKAWASCFNEKTCFDIR